MNNLAAEKNRRILIIDDNRAIHEDFRKILSPASSAAAALEASETELFGKPVNAVRKIQYEIDSAYQGQEGMLMVQQAQAEGRPYALAFVDIRMPPGWDGVETTQKIWAVDPEIQIVLCTAYADYSWDEMFAKIGNSDGLVILKKPFDTVEALQLAHAFTEKWWLHRQSRKKMEELEMMVAERTAELQWKTALLEAQVASTMDGILIVDEQRQKLLQNRRMDELFKIPRAIAQDKNDDAQLHWVAGVTTDPESFLANVLHLNAHPDETSREELSLKDGTFLERYSGPVTGAGGKYYGRLWTFRDITARKQMEIALKESEQRYHSLFENMLEGYAYCRLIYEQGQARDYIYLEVNRAFEPQCGLKNVIGKKISEVVPGMYENNPEQFEVYSRVALTGRAEQFETHAKLLDIWFAVSVYSHQKEHFIAIFDNITERKRAEESLRLLNSAVEQSKESIVITDAQLDLPGPKILFVNAAFTQMTGYAAADILGKTPRMFQGPRTDKAVLKRLRQNLEDGEQFAGETINYRKDGKEFVLEWQIAPIRNAAGTITHFVGIERDITGRKKLQEQLVQSQKMETVGKLAGGIAHEFNSILTAIIGQSELLLEDLPAGSPLTENVTEISKAAHRAATLTRQLLAYGRKQFLQPEILDLNHVAAALAGVLQHLLGSDVTVQIVPAAGLRAVKADAGQIEQVIMNLVINARDAMPNGGQLTLETANVTFDRDSVGRYPELKPGDYVALAISDTGTGMSDAVKARMFEPFFSTKGVGQGTGLGLSTCYGIIKQSGGHISVYSELGRGTTFKIYLPQADAPAKISAAPAAAPDLPAGTETILLVEDDPALREMAATLLRRLGYTVFTAANGVEALSVQHERRTGHIDLLFTDVVMPHMSGKELADRVRALYPDTKILFTSAYTETAIVQQGVLNAGVALLQKPFTPAALAHKLREVLDRKKSSAK